MLRTFCLSVVMLFSFETMAIVNGHEYPFQEGSEIENISRAELFRELAEELRCPKCQNQNLADSNAMIASDLRRELYKQVKAGKDGPSIVEFMVNRYGEFVLYKPKMNSMTLVLWFGPVGLALLAILIFIVVVRSRRKKAQGTVNDEALDPQEAQRVQQLLNNTSEEKK